MITLTKLNGGTVMVNAVHIESVESCPDTRVALTNGKQIYVKETPESVRELVRGWLAACGGWHGLCAPPPGPAPDSASVTDRDGG